MNDLFGPSLAPAPPPRRPTEPIVREALVEDGCRYWLKRAWGAGPCVLWAMCNPSDADSRRDDPTMWRVMEFSLRWGFGSCIVVNVVPRISPDPAMALAWLRLKDSADPQFAHRFREQWIRNIHICAAMMDKAERHIVAWGNSLPWEVTRDWQQEIAEASEEVYDEDARQIEFECLGITGSGAPKHPLARGRHRVPADFAPIKWTGT